NGGGDGAVTYSVAANPGAESRSGNILIAGRLFTITQSGFFTCNYSLADTNRSYGGGATNDTVNIDANCSWTVWSTNAWVTILSGPNGSGTGSVAYAVAANPNSQPRSAKIIIGGQTLAITQAAHDPAIISQPTNQIVPPGGTAIFSAGVSGTSPFTYQWYRNGDPLADGNGISGAASSTLTLIGVEKSQEGSYSVTVSNSAGGLWSSTALLTVSCSHTLFPNTATFTSLSAIDFIVINGNTNCPWNLVNTNPWVTILSGETNFGNGTLVYSVAENPTTNARSGRIYIADRIFIINQAGSAPTNATVSLAEALDTVGTLPWGTTGAPVWFGQSSVSHDGVDAAQSGPIGNSSAVTVQTTVNGPGTISFWWKVSSELDKDFLKFFINGVQQIRISGEVDWELRSLPIPAATNILKWTYSKNASGAEGRDRGWLDQVRFLPGTGCVASLSQTSITNSWNFETGQVSVAAADGCTWAVNNTNPWITPLMEVGEGTNNFRYTVATNASSVSRTGVVTIGGQSFTVVQLGTPCTYSISPSGRTVDYPGASGTISVTAPGGCPWSVMITNDWVTITGTSGASGSGGVYYSVAPNNTLFPRSGNIRVGDQLYSITQAAAGIPLSEALDTADTYLVWRTGGGFLWSGQSAVTHDGVDAAQSSGMDETLSSDSSLATMVMGPGVVTFWWKVSSQTNADGLRFYIGPSEQAFISGEVDWQQRTINVPPGPQNLEWNYTDRTPGSNGGLNRGWVDQVQYVQTGCAATLTPSSALHSASSSTGIVNVAISAGCPWNVFSSTNSWISILSGNGTGNGTFKYVVAANPSAFARSGYINIAGQNFFVAQSGNPPPECLYGFSPVGRSHNYLPATDSFTVSTPTGCAWSVFNTNAWVTINSNPNNSGSGSVVYTVLENTNAFARSGTIRAANQNFTISQAGAPIPMAEALDIVGTSLVVWSAPFPDWSGQTSVTHDGIDAAQSSVGGSFTLVANGPGTLTFWWGISSQTNSNLRFYLGGTEQLRISGNVNWDQQTVILPAGTQALEWHFAKSAVGSADRAWVDQVQFVPTGLCPVTLSPGSASHPSSFSTGSVSVAAAPDCAWTVFNTNSWISIAAGANGTGVGNINYILTANPSTSSRIGKLLIADKIFQIAQAGASNVPPPNCTISISPGSATHGTGVTTGLVSVTTQPGCTWSVVETNTWISILTSLNITNSGTVRYLLQPNTNLQSRTGAIRIGAENFVVTQLGTSSGTNRPRIQFMGRTGNGAILSVQGEQGKMYVVECSEDLIHWIPISTNSAPSTVTDTPVGNAPRRFYRTVQIP
ncbi:MAG TPA: BACON domain-containing carbohydrate-binding protein, partial [Verrucomicrobiae bacterium]